MSAAKHTPGPWRHYIGDHDKTCMSTLAGSVHIGDATDYSVGRDERLANARLIAAAPELLAALRGLIRAGHALTSASMEWNSAHAAITKATGEQA